MKRFLSLLLVLLALVGKQAQAADFEAGGIYYNITSDTECEVTSHPSRYSGSVTIPSSVTHDGQSYAVTAIGNQAFYYCRNLTSISIPSSVKTIGEWAFYYCQQLTSITIPNTVTKIGSNAFYNCSSLETITIPGSVEELGSQIFRRCRKLTAVTLQDGITSVANSLFSGCSGLKTVNLPSTITSIGDNAFAGCTSLQSMYISPQVTKIGKMAFAGCTSLPSIDVDEENQHYCTVDGVLFDKGMTTIMLMLDKNPVTEYKVPETVTTIESGAFYDCYSLTSITLPEGLKKIENDAFYWLSSLESLVIPAGVREIYPHAINGCYNLKRLIVKAILPPDKYYSDYEGDYPYGDIYQEATLCVPSISQAAYKRTGWWRYFSKVETFDVPIPDGYTQVGTNLMFKKQVGTSIDMVGASGEGGLCTSTRDNAGYTTTMQVDGGETVEVEAGGTTAGDVSASVTVEPWGGLAQLVYTVTNNATHSRNLTLGTSAGVSVAGDDNAVTSRLLYARGETYGLETKLPSTGDRLTVFLGEELNGVTAVDDCWSKDGDMGWSWTCELQAGETRTFSVMMGVGSVPRMMDKMAVNSRQYSIETPETIPFDGKPHAAMLITGTNTGECTVSYHSDETDIYYNGYAPTVPGTYHVNLTFKPGEYYRTATINDAAQFSILPPTIDYINISPEELIEKVSTFIPAIMLDSKRTDMPEKLRLCEVPPTKEHANDCWKLQGGWDNGYFYLEQDEMMSPMTISSGSPIWIKPCMNGTWQYERFHFILNYQQGDCNFDSRVSIQDLQSMVLYIFEIYPGVVTFNFGAADMNSDSKINVLDVVRLAKALLQSSDITQAGSQARRVRAQDDEAQLYVSDGKLMLRTTVPVAAADIMIDLPARWNTRLGMEIETQDYRHAVLYSMDGTTIPVGETVIATLDNEAQVLGAEMADALAQPVGVTFSTTATGIATQSARGNSDNAAVYDLSGRKTTPTGKGIYINRGKKVVMQ